MSIAPQNLSESRHAIERMTPIGFGAATGGAAGRGIPTIIVEATIKNGEKIASERVNDVTRKIWKMDTIQAVTANGGEMVLATMRLGG